MKRNIKIETNLSKCKIEFLPIKLIQKLNENIFNNNKIEYRTKNNFLKCVGAIYHHQINDLIGLNGYVPLGSDYWKEIFGGDYHSKVINPLLKLNIIQFYDFGYRSFSVQNNQSSMDKIKGLVGIRYRINPDLTYCECSIIQYNTKGKIVSIEEIVFNGGKEFDIEIIADKNFHVSILKERALSWIDENVAMICSEYLNTDYVNQFSDIKQIKYHEYIEAGSFNSEYSTVQSAKAHAKFKDKQLFVFKGKFYIADIEQFLKNRIESMKYHFKREISKVGVLPLVNNRSKVNLRVHNYLVNFPSKILQFITINNQTVVQFDLKTSQFLLFANLLNVYIQNGEDELLSLFKQKKNIIYLKRLVGILKGYKNRLPSVGVDIYYSRASENSISDVTNFIRDIFFNDFYSIVQKVLELPERSLAKQEVFKLLFKNDNRPDAELNKLKLCYPTVLAIISDFKKESNTKTSKVKIPKNDDRVSNFSVFLQCIEAEIFIDNILKPMREQNIPCFTRHDSIVVAYSFKEQAESFIKSVFESFGFRYNSKFDDKVWEVFTYKEFEDSDIWDSEIDEDLLNPNYPFDDGYAEPKKEQTIQRQETI